MRADEALAAGAVVGDLTDLAVDTARTMHVAIATRMFDAAARGLGPLVAPFRAIHLGLATATYRAVHLGVTAGVKATSWLGAAARPSGGPSVTDSPRGSQLVGVINGIVGDRMEHEGNALALPLTLRHNGRDLPTTAAGLADAHARATSRVAVFVPGLCETEAAWHYRADEWYPNDPPTHGDRLRRDLGLTPLWVRYNTGRRVSANGADLDRLLGDLVAHWPVPVRQIDLVGYSMGGLIVRSAVHQAADRHAAWANRVGHVVGLGTPYHGAPLEKFANSTTHALGMVDDTRPIATLLNRRSVGIKDLRYGNVAEDDWRDWDPDALLHDTRTDVGLIDGIDYHVIAATIRPGRVGHLLGDLMVRIPSATGRGRRALPFQRQIELAGMHHLALLNHPVVYDHLRDALAAPRSALAAL